jgi:phosphoglycerate-specific signal transduction histidine kinase
MRFNISTKLFLGFLFVIFLNIIYFVVVNKLSYLNIYTEILKRQEQVKNALLQTYNIQKDKKRSRTSFEAIGKQESVTNFKQTSLLMRQVIDSIRNELDVISHLDSSIVKKFIIKNPHYLNHLALISTLKKIDENIYVYDNTFLKMALSGKHIDSLKYITDEKGILLTAILDSSDQKITILLKTADSLIDEQNKLAIKATESRIEEIKKMTLIILAIVTLVSIGFALFFSRIITYSLRRLKESASQIGKGKFTVDSYGYPHDEIGDLAKAFQDMAINLKNTQEELIKSKRLAAIGEIVASVNHEINNPLMIISGNAQFLEMYLKDASEDIKERIKTILEETERISRVTKKLREIKNPVAEEYTSSGEQMINLDKSY